MDMDQQEIEHRLQGNILQDPYGARKVAKQITEREMVNHPDHYQGNKFEVIDIIEDYKLGFSLGNAIKYILRSDKKGARKQDLQKAIWYIQREIDREDL
jgi:sulfur relay (sulfurtransferase) DsrC/TusE family protein